MRVERASVRTSGRASVYTFKHVHVYLRDSRSIAIKLCQKHQCGGGLPALGFKLIGFERIIHWAIGPFCYILLVFMSPPFRVGRHVVFPRASVCPSVCHKTCPFYNLKTVKDFSMKLGTLVDSQVSDRCP